MTDKIPYSGITDTEVRRAFQWLNIILEKMESEGGDADLTFEREAAEDISALHFVKVDADFTVSVTDWSDPDVSQVAGMTITAADAGEDVKIQSVGEYSDGSWNWEPGLVYVGSDGKPTQTVPTDADKVLHPFGISPDGDTRQSD
ncbi:MAG: hypothetical protein ACOCSQ_03410, partial [Planctomycetota bacterium]